MIQKDSPQPSTGGKEGKIQQAPDLIKEREKLLQEARELQAKLDRYKAIGLVSEEEKQEYENTQERLEEINKKIAEIESNPYVIELLLEEAKSEDEIRRKVIFAATSSRTWQYPKAEEIIKRIIQRFLTEEFKARDFDNIKDPKMKEFAFLITSILRQADDTTYHQIKSLKDGERVGILLKNLIGRQGTIEATIYRIADAVGLYEYNPDNPKKEEIDTLKKYIKHHLGTLNFLRAVSFALDPYYGENFWGQYRAPFNPKYWERGFDQPLSSLRFEVKGDGPIIPNDADEETKRKIRIEYVSTQIEILQWQIEETQKEIESLNRKIGDTERKLQELEEVLSEAKGAEKFVKQVREGSVPGLESLRSRIPSSIDKAIEFLDNEIQAIENKIRRISKLGEEIQELESQLEKKEKESSKIGWLKGIFIKRSRDRKQQLTEEIEGIKRDIKRTRDELEKLGDLEDLEKQKENLEKLKKAFSILKEKDPLQIDNEIRKTQESLKDLRCLKERLEELLKSLNDSLETKSNNLKTIEGEGKEKSGE
jgi:DNA repair exonuclease SbcCD ATPase subunit